MLAGEAGFTLIEMLIATLILMIAIAGLAGMLTEFSTRSQREMTAVGYQADARAVVDTLATEVRGAYTGDPSTNPIATMTTTQLTFYTPDRQQPFHLQEISYRLSGTSLQRASALTTNTSSDEPAWKPWPLTLGSWGTAVDGVVANPGGDPLFSYEDASGNPTTDPTAVATVIVELSVAPPPGVDRPTTYKESATIRAVSSS